MQQVSGPPKAVDLPQHQVVEVTLLDAGDILIAVLLEGDTAVLRVTRIAEMREETIEGMIVEVTTVVIHVEIGRIDDLNTEFWELRSTFGFQAELDENFQLFLIY